MTTSELKQIIKEEIDEYYILETEEHLLFCKCVYDAMDKRFPTKIKFKEWVKENKIK